MSENSKSRFHKAMNQLESAFKNQNSDKENSEQDPEIKSVKTQDIEPHDQEYFDTSFQKAVDLLKKQKEDKQSDFLQNQQQENRHNETLQKNQQLSNFEEKKLEQSLEKSLYSVLKKILQTQKTNNIDEINLDSFFADNQDMLKNRQFLKEKFGQFSNMLIDFYVNLGKVSISLDQLKKLEEGNVIETEIAVDDLLDCYVSKETFGKGSLNINNFSIGFRLNKFHK